jgi:TrmH family RNA methyltransferase
LEQASAHTFEITEQVAQKLADTQSPQGVFAICAQPPSLARGVPEGRGELCLALENLRDPGNLGAAARTAQALGLHGLLLSGGCDIYHPKALRASMGALLRLPVSHVDDLPAALRASALPCYAAVPDAGALPVTACDFTRGAVVVIGSEADGLTPETIAACTRQVTIPMPGRAESLNAAAAATIIMWEMTKQLTVDN